MKYRDNMGEEDLNALLAEWAQLNACYAEMDDQQCAGDEDQEEGFDPIRDGWVGKDGRP